jgi:O-antigen/teichoic acid export membrane protein
MIRSAAGTIATRVIVTVGNLVAIMAAGHVLGSEGLGTISLLVLGITLILLLNNVVGGAALTYLVPRHPLRRLLLPAYAWALITAGIALLVLRLVPLVPVGFSEYVVGLALLQSFTATHSAVLLGQQRIPAFNALGVLQALLLPIVFVVLAFGFGQRSVLAYVYSAYAAFLLTALVAAFMVARSTPTTDEDHAATKGDTLRAMLRQGGWVQAANLLQLLNYRLAYYLIERWVGLAALGVYSVTTQLAESAWLGPKSLGTVLYARISNTELSEQHRGTTIAILKASVALAAGVVLILLMVPDPLYAMFFGRDVKGVQPLLLVLVPGLLGMAASQAYSHYFSGVGLNRHNAIGSGIGLACTVVFGFWLIPAHGLAGAAITASVAYSANALYQMVFFLRATGAAFRDLMPRPSDLGLLRAAWKDK